MTNCKRYYQGFTYFRRLKRLVSACVAHSFRIGNVDAIGLNSTATRKDLSPTDKFGSAIEIMNYSERHFTSYNRTMHVRVLI